MKSLLETLLGGLLVALGYLMRQRENKTKQTLFCADIKLTEPTPGIYQADPCTNKATVILGSKSLCDDHLDLYLSEMTGTLEE